MDKAEVQKQEANGLVKAKDFVKASEKYLSAINAVRLNQSLKGVKAARDLEVACRGNLTLCKINLKQFDEAVDQCEKVLEYDPKNVKATFRMA